MLRQTFVTYRQTNRIPQFAKGNFMTNHTTYRTNFQASALSPTVEICSLCREDIIGSNVAAGPYNSAGELTLICNQHLRDPRQFINLLADFMSIQRFELAQNLGYQKLNMSEDTPNAWFLH
jgi:hypothetical protein